MSLINTKFIKWTAAGVLAAGALGMASTASAGVGVSVGIALPGVAIGVVNPAPVYYGPPPAVYRPAPVYYAPPPIRYRPAPVYYAPRPYYRPGPPPGRGYYRHDNGHHHGYDRR